jgi:hypothetical protein
VRAALPSLVALAAALGAVPSHAEPTLALHLSHWVPEVDVPPCTAPELDGFDCNDIVVEGPREVIQKLYLVATGVETLSKLEFGVDCGVSNLTNFDNCSGATLHSVGLGLPWPCMVDRVLTWDPPVEGTGPDGIVIVGYFRLHAVDTIGAVTVRGLEMPPDFSFGLLRMWANGEEYILEEDQRGAADPAAYGDGFNPCTSVVPVAGRSWSGIKSKYR